MTIYNIRTRAPRDGCSGGDPVTRESFGKLFLLPLNHEFFFFLRFRSSDDRSRKDIIPPREILPNDFSLIT